jgi:hypothetical protein
LRRGKLDWAGIMAAGKFHQCRDSGGNRRMGVEQFAKALTRIVDTHFHHR